MITEQTESVNIRSVNAHRRSENVATIVKRIEQTILEDNSKMKEKMKVIGDLNNLNDSNRRITKDLSSA